MLLLTISDIQVFFNEINYLLIILHNYHFFAFERIDIGSLFLEKTCGIKSEEKSDLKMFHLSVNFN